MKTATLPVTALPSAAQLAATTGSSLIQYGSIIGHMFIVCLASIATPITIAGRKSVAPNSLPVEIKAPFVPNPCESSIASTFIAASANQEKLPRRHEQFNRGSHAANQDIPPISDNAVELMLSEQD